MTLTPPRAPSRTSDYIFRNYYHSDLMAQHKHLHWLPNGMKSGLGHASGIPATLPLASQRRFLCNFLGSMRSHRKDMLEYLKSQVCAGPNGRGGHSVPVLRPWSR